MVGLGAWMPLVVALIYAPIGLTALCVLDSMPPPTRADREARSLRRPMTTGERSAFLKEWYPFVGLGLLGYMVLTGFRGYRDYFSPEIYRAVLGRELQPWDFLIAELPGGVIAVMTLSSLSWIVGNRKALFCIHYMMMAGAALVGISTMLHSAGLYSGLELGQLPAFSLGGACANAMRQNQGAPLLFFGDIF